MIDQLKTIGIEKGKPFSPDANTQKILNDAVREAARLGSMARNTRATSLPPFNELGQSLGAARYRRTSLEGLMQTQFANPDAYPVEGRGVGYSMGYFSSKHLGTGQFYLTDDKAR